MANLKAIHKESQNIHFTFASPISTELKIDQSVSHNGVCLTVVDVKDGEHTVTAIQETLDKTNMKELAVGELVNIERCLKANARFDGHIVQGHVDCTATCIQIRTEGGSWKFSFIYDYPGLTVEKGSISVNGCSLTVVDSQTSGFSVAIIPYTFEHTVFKTLKKGDRVNLEFDIIGKYIQKVLQKKRM